MKTDFTEQVYDLVKLIPKGRVTSYGQIAKAISMPSAARMVGYAMNKAHGDNSIPAHRVVNRNGLLTGKMHFNYPEEMQELLESEGIKIKNDQIIDFKSIFWDPLIEIQL